LFHCCYILSYRHIHVNEFKNSHILHFLDAPIWTAKITVVNVNNTTVRMWLINMPKEGETISDAEPSGSANTVSARNNIQIRPTRDNTKLGDFNKKIYWDTQAG
jgi:hypothetical protein